MTATKRNDAAPPSQRRHVYLPNLDDQLKSTLAPALYARLRAEAERRNVGLAQVARALSTK